jgi:hypothetical protein
MYRYRHPFVGRINFPLIASRLRFPIGDSGPVVETLVFSPVTGDSATAETVTFTDAQSASVVFNSTRAESVTFTDSQAATLVISSTEAETVTFTDSQNAATVRAGATAESITFTDSQDGTVPAGTSQNDETVTFTDAQSASVVYPVARAESITFTDSQSTGLVTSGQRNESVTFTDAQSSIAVFASTENESVTFTDAQSASFVASVTRDETVAFSDSQDASVVSGTTPTVSESLSFTDSQDASVVPGVDPFVIAFGGGNAKRDKLAKKLIDDERKRLEDEQHSQIEAIAIEQAIHDAQHKVVGYKTVTLEHIIGKKASAMMNISQKRDLEEKIQRIQRKQQMTRDDEELMMLY